MIIRWTTPTYTDSVWYPSVEVDMCNQVACMCWCQHASDSQGSMRNFPEYMDYEGSLMPPLGRLRPSSLRLPGDNTMCHAEVMQLFLMQETTPWSPQQISPASDRQ